MLAATNLLRPGPTRVGSLGRITLPRTVRLRSLVAWGIGGAGGLLIGAVAASFVGGLLPVAVGGFLGAGAGHLVVNVEPVPGETAFSWLRLASTGRHNRVAVNGAATRIVMRSVDDGPPDGCLPIEVARAADWVAYAVPAGSLLEASARAYIGICPLGTVIAGEVSIIGGLVAVEAGSVDDRGVPVGDRPVRRWRPPVGPPPR